MKTDVIANDNFAEKFFYLRSWLIAFQYELQSLQKLFIKVEKRTEKELKQINQAFLTTGSIKVLRNELQILKEYRNELEKLWVFIGEIKSHYDTLTKLGVEIESQIITKNLQKQELSPFNYILIDKFISMTNVLEQLIKEGEKLQKMISNLSKKVENLEIFKVIYNGSKEKRIQELTQVKNVLQNEMQKLQNEYEKLKKEIKPIVKKIHTILPNEILQEKNGFTNELNKLYY